MTLSFDGDPRIDHRRCDHCGREHDSAHGLVLRDGTAHAAYWAAWYPHEEQAIVDVTLGSWQEPAYADNVMFGCRIGPVEGQAEPACSLVHSGQTLRDSPILGRKLTRDEALEHPWLSSFWEVLDWLILNDSTLHEHVFHMPPQSSSSP
jgi:hypothetical protein